jgi:hypothetical protein
MKKQIEVTITEVLVMKVMVEADDNESAISQVQNSYHNAEFTLDWSNLKKTDFTIATEPVIEPNMVGGQLVSWDIMNDPRESYPIDINHDKINK